MCFLGMHYVCMCVRADKGGAEIDTAAKATLENKQKWCTDNKTSQKKAFGWV